MRIYKNLPRAERRILLLNDMPKPLRGTALTVEDKLHAAARGVLLIAYDVGLLTKAMVDDEAEYGSRAILQLANFLGIPECPTTFYTWWKLTTFTREFLKQQIAVPMANGHCLEIAHFLLLADTQIKKQMPLLNEIRRECLSAHEARKRMVARGDLPSGTYVGRSRQPRGLKTFEGDIAEGR